MFRVSAFHFCLHLGIAALPETGQVARHLNRPSGGRQQVNQQRDPASRYGGRFGLSQHFL